MDFSPVGWFFFFSSSFLKYRYDVGVRVPKEPPFGNGNQSEESKLARCGLLGNTRSRIT